MTPSGNGKGEAHVFRTVCGTYLAGSGLCPTRGLVLGRKAKTPCTFSLPFDGIHPQSLNTSFLTSALSCPFNRDPRDDTDESLSPSRNRTLVSVRYSASKAKDRRDLTTMDNSTNEIIYAVLTVHKLQGITFSRPNFDRSCHARQPPAAGIPRRAVGQRDRAFEAQTPSE